MRRLVIGAILAAAAAAGGGCGGGDGDRDGRAPALVHDAPLAHVHGVGATSDGTVYVATHEGLFAAPAGETTVERVGELEHDLMGFAVAGERRFVASGHPDARANLPPHLGLVESTDGGETWRSVSLLGRADFHVLRVAGRRLYGFDGLEGRLMVSDDGGRSWSARRSTPAMFDLAIDPRDRDRLVAATDAGLYVSGSAGRRWRRANPRMAGLLAWPRGGRPLLVDARGGVHRGDASGRRWRQVGRLDGEPVALAAANGDLLAATTDGTVVASADGGATWSVRASP
ncbi:MAG TPA: hypothetical protein VHF89_14145 [Solirubrobacteraceae bacterium]|nr:hypothetical protein [Solirubrobacteraceae bacterium]